MLSTSSFGQQIEQRPLRRLEALLKWMTAVNANAEMRRLLEETIEDLRDVTLELLTADGASAPGVMLEQGGEVVGSGRSSLSGDVRPGFDGIERSTVVGSGRSSLSGDGWLPGREGIHPALSDPGRAVGGQGDGDPVGAEGCTEPDEERIAAQWLVAEWRGARGSQGGMLETGEEPISGILLLPDEPDAQF